jgi:hypothetical protein
MQNIKDAIVVLILITVMPIVFVTVLIYDTTKEALIYIKNSF